MINESELVHGLWYEDADNPVILDGKRVSFMKIYNLNLKTYVMEISTYPRAYKDTVKHVYLVDTPFIVTEENCNFFDTVRCYRDFKGVIFQIGEEAVHYKGEPLPGDFPKWIESETLSTPPTVDNKNTIFPLVYQAIKGELVNTTLIEGVYKQDTDATWSVIPPAIFSNFSTLFGSLDREIKIPKLAKNKHRTIARIKYNRFNR